VIEAPAQGENRTKGLRSMQVFRWVIILLSIGILALCIAVKYDLISIAIIEQVMANREFEFALVAYALLFLVSFRRGKRPRPS
jgi:hypothetical protein